MPRCYPDADNADIDKRQGSVTASRENCAAVAARSKANRLNHVVRDACGLHRSAQAQSFLLFLPSRSFSRFSSQIAAVAIGWQVYDLTGSAFDLGMVGLVQFLPTALLMFVAGHAADRYERKRVVQVCQFAEALTAVFLAWGAYAGWLTVVQIFIATAVLGTATAFESPAAAALLPLIAPQGSLQRATAISSGAAQIATITGPALGGLAYAIAPSMPYGLMVVFWLSGTIADRRDPV